MCNAFCTEKVERVEIVTGTNIVSERARHGCLPTLTPVPPRLPYMCVEECSSNIVQVDSQRRLVEPKPVLSYRDPLAAEPLLEEPDLEDPAPPLPHVLP